MTETRTVLPQTGEAFTREVLAAIEAARGEGAVTPEEIATALNRAAVTTWRGRQWDAELLLAFLASPDTERLAG